MSIPPDKPSNHSVVILAAGLSQRLGQPKQLLTRCRRTNHTSTLPSIHTASASQTLLASVVTLAAATNPLAIVLVVPQPLYAVVASAKRLQQQTANLFIAKNCAPELGMANSLRLGLGKLVSLRKLQNFDSKRVLIMGVDQILLDHHHLAKLLAGQQSVVASEYPLQYSFKSVNANTNTITGLPLIVELQQLQSWQSKLIGDKGLRDLIRVMPSHDVGKVYNAQLSYDVDTCDDLAFARRHGWLQDSAQQ